MRCPECQEENDDDARRCTACGAHLDEGDEGTDRPEPGAWARDEPTVRQESPSVDLAEAETRVDAARPLEGDEEREHRIATEETELRELPAPSKGRARDVATEETELREALPGTARSADLATDDTAVARTFACTACSAEARPGWRFCKSCGAPLGRPGSASKVRHVLVELDPLEGMGRRTHELIGGSTVVGRALGDLVLPDDPTLSSAHAAFELDEERCHVRDLDSTNGTFVEVHGFETMQPGCVLLVGSHRLLYRRRSGSEADARELVLVARGGRERSTHPLGDGPSVVGSGNVDVALPSAPHVAEKHAEITWTGATHAARSLSKPHRTWISIARRRVLEDGAIVRLGDGTVLQYRRRTKPVDPGRSASSGTRRRS